MNRGLPVERSTLSDLQNAACIMNVRLIQTHELDELLAHYANLHNSDDLLPRSSTLQEGWQSAARACAISCLVGWLLQSHVAHRPERSGHVPVLRISRV